MRQTISANACYSNLGATTMTRYLQHIGVFALAAGLAACSDANGPNGTGQVSFSEASRLSSSTASSADTFAINGNVLVISRVQLVLDKIKLKRTGSAVDCDADTTNCGDLKVAPILVDLPLTPGPAQAFSASLAAGTYDQIQLQVHKPSVDSTEDSSILAANPGFAGVSIRVTGTFNGAAFVFTTDVSAKEKMDLAPLNVVSAGSTNLTFFVDLRSWFLNAAQTDLVDPATALAGQPNESLVENNIKASFKAFKDDDRDAKIDP